MGYIPPFFWHYFFFRYNVCRGHKTAGRAGCPRRFSMKILISPAKKMKVIDDHPFTLTTPVFQQDFQELDRTLAGLSFADLCRTAKASEKVMGPVYQNLQHRKTHPDAIILTPALLAYDGIAFTNMAPGVFESDQWDYVQKHLRILSGAYGVLRPLDGIVSYRLEMQSRIPFSLYEYWNSRIADTFEEDELLINLASEEYAKVIRPYHPLLDIQFLEQAADGSCKEKGVYVKIARGTMVRWMAQNQVESVEELKAFQELGYHLCNEKSTPDCLVFVRKEEDIPKYKTRRAPARTKKKA